MRSKRYIWLRDGRPRGDKNITCNDYKEAKQNFRRYDRVVAEAYLRKALDNLDHAACVDNTQIWRLYNARSNKNTSSVGNEY